MAAGGVGILFFVLGALLMWKRKAPRATVVLWFGASLGIGGWIGSMLGTGTGWLIQLLGYAVGATAGAVLLLALGFLVGHDLLPKHKGAADRKTAFAALLLPIVALGVGGGAASFIVALSQGINHAGSAVMGGLF